MNKQPKHVAIIMDGNGRWAKKQGKKRVMGHSKGAKSVREIVEAAAREQIEFLTLFAFSTDNWNRPKEEVNILMKLLVSSLKKEFKRLIDNNIRLCAIGHLKSLPVLVQEELLFVIEKTGFREETEQLRKDLEPYGLLQFVRSGRISVTKAKMGISEILHTFKTK